MRRALPATLLALAGCATVGGQEPGLVPGARYVAMGSSYAAGAGIGALAPGTPQRCGRTVNNYPRLVAARLGLDLADVSCGGATTAHVLGPWNELAPQIEAVTRETRLVTVTIGGNDIGYVRNLAMASCGKGMGREPAAGQPCPSVAWPQAADYAAVRRHMEEIGRQVRRRAPQARLVFVDYLRIVPEAGGCAQVPLGPAQADAARASFAALALATAEAARAAGAMLIAAGKLSRKHHGCSAEPWAVGAPGQPAPWHPTAAGHKAIADALVAKL